MSKQKATYQCTNACDCLIIGEHYDSERKPGTRMVKMTSHTTGRVVSLYTWQIEQAVLGGALKVVSDALRDSLHCAVGDRMFSSAERLQTVESVRGLDVSGAEMRNANVSGAYPFGTDPEWFPE